MTARRLTLAVVVAPLLLSAALSPLGVSADEPPPVVPCGSTDQATVLGKLNSDRTLIHMRSWERAEVEFLDCDTSLTELPLRLTYLSPESATRRLGLRFAMTFEATYDLATQKVLPVEPTLDARRTAADTTLGHVVKNAAVAELKAAVEALEGTLEGRVDAAGQVTLHSTAFGGKADEPLLTLLGDQLIGASLPLGVSLPSNLHLTAFQLVANALEHEGKTCPAPEHYTASHVEAGVWTFEFAYKSGACKGKWRVTMTPDASVSLEKL